MNKYTEASFLIAGLFGMLVFAGGVSWGWSLTLSIALLAIGRLQVLVNKG